mgnify:CR=1 FL=1
MRAVFDILAASTELRDRLESNTARFREGMTAAGFAIKPGVHPICPIMLGDARLASTMADRLLDEGIYVIGFSFPVVPKGQARIRVQISAGHSPAQIDQAIAAFPTSPHVLQRFHKTRLVECPWVDLDRQIVVPMAGRARLCPIPIAPS